MYSKEDVLEYIESEDVKFIKLAFCDVFGRQKNISILSTELNRAFEYGISFDASAISGFSDEAKSDLFLFPDPSTIEVLPWRPMQGKVVRMICDIKNPDGTPFEADTRNILKNAVSFAKKNGIELSMGSEFEFYLFKTDDDGNPTEEPFDNAGYFDIAPFDRGENVRREICLTLENMDIYPESSHHEEGPGQNEIDFKHSDPLSSADNAITFKSVTQTIAAKNGLYASFMPKPVKNSSGNGMHINISLTDKSKQDSFIAGILENIAGITAFLNPIEQSYVRLGEKKAPFYITWAEGNRSQLIRIPAESGERSRFELRSPDPMANPYLVYALLIYAGAEGVINKRELCEPCNINLYSADKEKTENLPSLPKTFDEAISLAKDSEIVKKYMPDSILEAFKKNNKSE
ncbi:MAG: glutamine synthetase [Clostridia bacterium]|nr:glutamine synthetase [Clostridia bacterium]